MYTSSSKIVGTLFVKGNNSNLYESIRLTPLHRHENTIFLHSQNSIVESWKKFVFERFFFSFQEKLAILSLISSGLSKFIYFETNFQINLVTTLGFFVSDISDAIRTPRTTFSFSCKSNNSRSECVLAEQFNLEFYI